MTSAGLHEHCTRCSSPALVKEDYPRLHNPTLAVTASNWKQNEGPKWSDFGLRLSTCISCVTERSNIHKPRREAATPLMSIMDATLEFWTHIDATDTESKEHCTQRSKCQMQDEKCSILTHGQQNQAPLW